MITITLVLIAMLMFSIDKLTLADNIKTDTFKYIIIDTSSNKSENRPPLDPYIIIRR